MLVRQCTLCRCRTKTWLSFQPSWLCTLEMGGNVLYIFSIPIPPFPNSSFLFTLPLPGLAQCYSYDPIPSRCQFHTNISSHLLLLFVDTIKLITSKLTKNGSLFVSKQLKIKPQIAISKLCHFSRISIFLK